MKSLVRAAGGASLYFFGAASGFALAIPLAAVALGANAGTKVTPVAGLHAPAIAYQSQMVNRTSKGARLDVSMPAAGENATMVAKTDAGNAQTGTSASVARANSVTSENVTPVAAQPIRIQPASPTQTSPARATPKGCLSAIGATRSNLATDELTVCVADASVLRNIE